MSTFVLRGNTDSESRERRFALVFAEYEEKKNNKNINLQIQY